MLLPICVGQSIEADVQQPRSISDEVPGETLKNSVKVFFDSVTRQYVLVGEKVDVAIVKRSIVMLNERFSALSHTVTEKILLEFQLAETVAEILSNSMALESGGATRLRIHPLHFPESILLVGPRNEVERAKRIVKSMDSHPGFPSK